MFACASTPPERDSPTHGSGDTLTPMRLPMLVALVLTTALPAQQNPNTTPDAPPQTAIPTDAPLNPALPTLFLVGDSTARNKADLGWGDHLAPLFDTTKINIANRAAAGRSSRTYINEGRWTAVLAEMKAGDFVLIQMGHNDGGDLGGAKPRGTLKGIGDESRDVPQTSGPLSGQIETVHTYGWYLRKYIAETRAKKATPILLTLTVRNIWTPGPDGRPRIERDMGFRDFEYQAGAAEQVAVIDMATVAADRWETLGPEKTATYFPVDHTHTSAAGADLNAHAVVTAIRNAGSPLVAYLAGGL